MAIGSTMAAIIAATAVAGSIGTSMYSAQQAKKAAPEMPAMPDTSPAKVTAQAQEATTEKLRQKKAAMSRSKSVYTSPLGIRGEAQTARKMLLGE